MVYSPTPPLSLADVRGQLLHQIAQRPAPEPTARDVRDALRRYGRRLVRDWQRRHRLASAQRLLQEVQATARTAETLGVTSRTVRYWRAGTYAPSDRNWQRLVALVSLCRMAELRGACRARVA